MTMTAQQEPSKYSLCLFPVRQVSPGRPKWVQIADEEGNPGNLTLVDTGGESDFYGGYAFLPPPGFMEIREEMPGRCEELFVKEDARRVKERTPVLLFRECDLRAFQDAVRKFADRLSPETKEIHKRIFADIGVTEFFELILQNTMSLLYDDNPFRYWKMMVSHGFVPYMIEEKLWEGWEQYEGRERDYVSSGGYVGTQGFSYSFYGTAQSRACDGIREVGRYLREQTKGRLNEGRTKDFLRKTNPLECGRYVCGVKKSDRTTVNNGGYGGGYIYKLLYDKEAVYQGMREEERR